MRHVRHTIPQPNVTAAGNTGAVDNLGNIPTSGKVIVEIIVPTVTGAGASWTPKLQGSIDGTNWVDLGTFAAITAAGTYRLVVSDVFEPQLQVSWPLPAGTTPVFTSPTIHILFPVA